MPVLTRGISHHCATILGCSAVEKSAVQPDPAADESQQNEVLCGACSGPWATSDPHPAHLHAGRDPGAGGFVLGMVEGGDG